MRQFLKISLCLILSNMIYFLLFFFFCLAVPPSFQRNGNPDSGIVSAGEVKDVILNNPISLYCETNAVPPPTLTWYKDGQLLTSSSRVLILPGTYALRRSSAWSWFVLVNLQRNSSIASVRTRFTRYQRIHFFIFYAPLKEIRFPQLLILFYLFFLNSKPHQFLLVFIS